MVKASHDRVLVNHHKTRAVKRQPLIPGITHQYPNIETCYSAQDDSDHTVTIILSSSPMSNDICYHKLIY